MQTVPIPDGYRDDSTYLFRHRDDGLLRISRIDPSPTDGQLLESEESLRQLAVSNPQQFGFNAGIVQRHQDYRELASTVEFQSRTERKTFIRWYVLIDDNNNFQIDLSCSNTNEAKRRLEELRQSIKILREPGRNVSFADTTTGQRTITTGRLQLTMPEGYHDETVVSLSWSAEGAISFRVMREKVIPQPEGIKTRVIEYQDPVTGKPSRGIVVPGGVKPLYSEQVTAGSVRIEVLAIGTNPQLAVQALKLRSLLR